MIKVYESVLERVEKERDEYKRRLEESEKEKIAMARACKLKKHPQTSQTEHQLFHYVVDLFHR